MTEDTTETIEETNLFVDNDDSEPNKIPVIQQLSLLAVILVLIFGSALSPASISKMLHKKTDLMATPIETREPEIMPDTETTNVVKPFSEVSITGKAAYVWDVNNQRVLYKKNEDQQLPLASVTKLMTALVAEELLSDTDKVSINEVAIRQDGDSGLLEGEVFDRLTLSDLVLMSSSNDGAFALASAAGAMLAKNDPANAFVQAMNIRAKEIGLSETYFKNPTGLDISTTEGGAYGTARDMTFLMEYIVKNSPDILTYTREDEARVYNQAGALHDAENTNYYINDIPGLIGSKTGYTDLAGGNLVVAFDAGFNRPVIISVLGSTRQERFTDVLELVSETQKSISNE